MHLSKLRRVRYFDGRLLTARDFETEQHYFREKSRRHNLFLHGAGIACGLTVSLESGDVRVEPGYALDGYGREVSVPEPAKLRLPVSGDLVYLCVQYAEREIEPAVGGKSTYVEEGYGLVYRPSNPFPAHGRRGRRRGVCGEAPAVPAVPLARLRRRKRVWRLDRTFRPPGAT